MADDFGSEDGVVEVGDGAGARGIDARWRRLCIDGAGSATRLLDVCSGTGDLLVESAGERGQTRIENVRKPEQVQLMIYTETEDNNNRMMRPGTQGATPSIPEQIEALARLKDQGVLSETEFETKKQELLKRL